MQPSEERSPQFVFQKKQVKNLVNKLHQNYRLKKKNRMTYATFKSTITEKLRSLKTSYPWVLSRWHI